MSWSPTERKTACRAEATGEGGASRNRTTPRLAAVNSLAGNYVARLTARETGFRNAAPDAAVSVVRGVVSGDETGQQGNGGNDPAGLPGQVGALVQEQRAETEHHGGAHQEPAIQLLVALDFL